MPDPLDFLSGGGETGALMRTRDWTDSPLGGPEEWPGSLRAVVGLLLQSRFPMFVAWGEELGFLYNDPYAEILGAKHPRALGSRFYDIWSEIWPDISPLIGAALAGQATYREDLPLLMNRRGYDEQTWFTFSYSPVRDESGRIAGMFCAVCETTQKVLAERALRESEARLLAMNETLERRVDEALAERKLLAHLVDSTNAFVVVVDLAYRILAINQAAVAEFERIYGARPAVGDHLLDLLDGQPEHQRELHASWSRALGGEVFTEVREFGNPLLDRRCYESRFDVLRDSDGSRRGAYQFVYDVTERVQDQEKLRRAEDTLRHSQKLESLGQLTGGVAHDFNNLLAVFASGLQILERSTSDAQRQRVFETMRRSVQRGTGLTRHLLAFSRRRPVNPESIDVAAQLHGMRTMLEGSLGGHIHVEMQLADDLWPIEVDAGEMELAMLNLCVNARDAMTAGGVINVTAVNVTVPDESGGAAEFVRICVADTGTGISPDVLRRVFEPFFTTKDVSKGSGLGLPQVYGFAQQSGGRVTIDSAVGQGTTVTLLLPRSLQRPASSTRTQDSQPSSSAAERRGAALLVEDDREVSALAREMLTTLGFAVTHVAGAEAALGALANSRNIDVVLSDVMMPGGVTGLELAREIRRRYPEIAVVLTTGYVESLADMADGEFALVLKPYTLEALADALGVSA